MSPMAILAVCLVLMVGGSTGRTTTTSRNVVDYLNLLGEDDRKLFIKVHLAKGLNSRSWDIPYAHTDPVIALPQELDISNKKYKQIEEIEVYEGFSENLVDYLRTDYNFDYDDIHTIVMNSEVCFPNSGCTDLGDIGTACCPF